MHCERVNHDDVEGRVVGPNEFLCFAAGMYGVVELNRARDRDHPETV